MKKDRILPKSLKSLDLMIEELMFDDAYEFANILLSIYPEKPIIINARIEQLNLFLCFEVFENMLIKYTGSDSTVIVPNGIEIIGKRHFANNNTITNIILSKSLTEIEYNAFYNCEHLEFINLPKNLTKIWQVHFQIVNHLKRLYLQII